MAIADLTSGIPDADGQQSACRDGHHQARSATHVALENRDLLLGGEVTAGTLGTRHRSPGHRVRTTAG
jgi:hypothetical protein